MVPLVFSVLFCFKGPFAKTNRCVISVINKYHLSVAAVLYNCVHGCNKRAFAWAAVTQTLGWRSCPDLLSRRSPVRQHGPESRLTKPRSARVTGNEEATGGGRAVRRTWWGGGVHVVASRSAFSTSLNHKNANL